MASAALPDDEAGFFFGVLGLVVAGAASAVLDSAGMALLLLLVVVDVPNESAERVPPSGRG